MNEFELNMTDHTHIKSLLFDWINLIVSSLINLVFRLTANACLKNLMDEAKFLVYFSWLFKMTLLMNQKAWRFMNKTIFSSVVCLCPRQEWIMENIFFHEHRCERNKTTRNIIMSRISNIIYWKTLFSMEVNKQSRNMNSLSHDSV